MPWEKLKQLVTRKKEMPSGLWMRCTGCHSMVYKRKVEELYLVCPECNFHFAMTSSKRVEMLLDQDSFEPMWTDLESLDPLHFVAKVAYKDKLISHKERSGLTDACIGGTGNVYGRKVVICVMDFSFCGGSMGSVVGEMLTRAIELGVDEGLPVVIINCSGGARMEEGALSLMQMAKTSAALARLHDAGGIFVSIMTHPTTGGVTASFASLGDVIIAEPGALIGFAGPRVIAETLTTDLPDGFQTSEFMLEHGFLDRIVQRKDLRKELVTIFGYLGDDYSQEDIKHYENVDAELYDAWVRAHETQRIDKAKASVVPQSNGNGNGDKEVDHENMGPDDLMSAADVLDT